MRIGPGAGRSLPALRIAASLLIVGGLAWRVQPADGFGVLVVLPAVLLLVVLPLRVLAPRLRVDMVMVAVACGVLVLHVAAVGTMLRRFYL